MLSNIDSIDANDACIYLRKIREGITQLKLNNQFAYKVYEFSVEYLIEHDKLDEALVALQKLVKDIAEPSHPRYNEFYSYKILFFSCISLNENEVAQHFYRFHSELSDPFISFALSVHDAIMNANYFRWNVLVKNCNRFQSKFLHGYDDCFKQKMAQIIMKVYYTLSIDYLNALKLYPLSLFEGFESKNGQIHFKK